jgi:hypothetical protein
MEARGPRRAREPLAIAVDLERQAAALTHRVELAGQGAGAPGRRVGVDQRRAQVREGQRDEPPAGQPAAHLGDGQAGDEPAAGVAQAVRGHPVAVLRPQEP